MPLKKFIPAIIIGRIPRYIFSAYAGKFLFETKFYASTQMSAILLGAMQGLTEFLPISSSGHLVILEHFLKLPIGTEEMAMFDIILHGGSLLAILVYFWKDWIKVLKEVWQMIIKRKITKDSLTLKLIIGTIPAIIGGLVFADIITGPLRNLHSIGIFFIILSILFFYSAWKGRKNKKTEVSLKQSLLIGFTQSLALIPGVSRSGITIATGTIAGIKRDVAAKFSFMLGGVAIMAANVYALFSVRNGAVVPETNFVIIGFIASFAFSLGAIIFLIRYLQKHTLRLFAFYLLFVGVMILSFM